MFSHLFLSRNVLSKLFILVAISWNFNFPVNLVTLFSRQKPLKSRNKKYRIFWNTEFYHPAKFELKRFKKCKSNYYLAAFCMCPGPACWRLTPILETFELFQNNRSASKYLPLTVNASTKLSPLVKQLLERKTRSDLIDLIFLRSSKEIG